MLHGDRTNTAARYYIVFLVFTILIISICPFQYSSDNKAIAFSSMPTAPSQKTEHKIPMERSAKDRSPDEISAIKREIVILNRARDNLFKKAELEQASKGTPAQTPPDPKLSKEDSDYVAHLNRKIHGLCSRLASLAGPGALTGLPCPMPTVPVLLPVTPRYQYGKASVTDGGYSSQNDRTNMGDADRELQESLGRFDDLLAAEQEKIMRARQGAETSGAGTGMGGGTGGGFSSQDHGVGNGYQGQRIGQEETAEDGSLDQHKQYPAGEPGENQEEKTGASDGKWTDRNGTPGRGGPEKGARSGKYQDKRRPSGIQQDDDIVAKQLRKAAEQETDPELKKRLWEEYWKYKGGQSAQ